MKKHKSSPSKMCKCGHYNHLKGTTIGTANEKIHFFTADEFRSGSRCADCPDFWDWAKEINES